MEEQKKNNEERFHHLMLERLTRLEERQRMMEIDLAVLKEDVRSLVRSIEEWKTVRRILAWLAGIVGMALAALTAWWLKR